MKKDTNEQSNSPRQRQPINPEEPSFEGGFRTLIKNGDPGSNGDDLQTTELTMSFGRYRYSSASEGSGLWVVNTMAAISLTLNYWGWRSAGTALIGSARCMYITDKRVDVKLPFLSWRGSTRNHPS